MTRTLDEIDAAILSTVEAFCDVYDSGKTHGPAMAEGGLAAVERLATRLLGEDHPTTLALRTAREARHAGVLAHGGAGAVS
jgi:hypothetical protein